MVFVELICVLCLLLFACYKWLTWHYGYWKNFGIKEIKPSLFFGNIKDVILMRKNMGPAYDVLYKVYPDEDVVGIYQSRTPQLMVRNPELVKIMLVKEFNSFHDNDIEESHDPVLNINPFSTKGEKWKEMRSIITPALTASKVKNMIQYMKTACKDMVEYLKQMDGQPLEAKKLGGSFTSEVVTASVYGLHSNSFTEPDSIYRKMIENIFIPGTLGSIVFNLFTIFPSIVRFLRLRIISKEVADFYVKLVKDTIVYRKQNHIQRDDFLDHLISIASKNDLSEEEIAYHSLTFVLDGYETSSILIGHIIDMLSRHPEVQTKLREEVQRKFPSLDELDFECIHSMKYLDAVINETLRIRPPGTVSRKICTKDIAIDFNGRVYNIKKGTSIAIPLYSFQLDEKYFPEPDQFKPERFLETSAPLGFFPFGLGPRACLGQKFALTQVKVFVAVLVSNFEIFPKESNPGPAEIDPMSGLLLYIKGGIWVKFKHLATSATN